MESLVYEHFKKTIAAMDDYRDCVVFLLAKAYQRAHGLLKDRLKEFGITPVQNLIMGAVQQDEGLTAAELGRKLVFDSATLSSTLDRMVDKGWLEKRADESDRRLTRLFLTPKARDLGQAVWEPRRRANDAALAGLTVEEKVLLKRLLRDVAD